jgi:predicted membrane protein
MHNSNGRFVGFVWDPLGSFGLCFWLAFGCFYVYSRCTQGRLTLLNKTFITYQKAMVVEFLLGAIPWTKDNFITKTPLDNFYLNKDKQKQIAKEKSEPNNKEIYSKQHMFLFHCFVYGASF